MTADQLALQLHTTIINKILVAIWMLNEARCQGRQVSNVSCFPTAFMLPESPTKALSKAKVADPPKSDRDCILKV